MGDGSVFRPYGGPVWRQPDVDKDGRVSHPVAATSAMYANPPPSRYTLPEVSVTRKRAPRWTVAGDAQEKVDRIGVGPAGYDQDPKCTRKGTDNGKRYTIAPRFPPAHKDKTPPAYSNCEANHLKNQLSTLPREPQYTNGRDLPYRVGKYVPGPGFYPIWRFPIPQYYKSPQKGPDPIVVSRKKLFSNAENPPPNAYDLPKYHKTRLRSHAPKYTMVPRREDPALADRSPGPAAYNTDSIGAIRKRAPCYSFGINGSCFTNMLGDMEPKEKCQHSKHCKVPAKHATLRYGKDV